VLDRGWSLWSALQGRPTWSYFGGVSDPTSESVPAANTPETAESSPDATLAGYTAHHSRPPAFEGSDAHPYTVSIEVERTPDLSAPYVAYLVFPRWALTGVGIVGHVETRTLVKAKSSDEARAGVGALTLPEVKALLDRAIAEAGEPTDSGKG